jgi:hypothetical protein
MLFASEGGEPKIHTPLSSKGKNRLQLDHSPERLQRSLATMATAQGERQVEALRCGDLEVTHNGKLEVGRCSGSSVQASAQGRRNAQAAWCERALRGGTVFCECTPLLEIATVQEGIQPLFTCTVEFASSNCI